MVEFRKEIEKATFYDPNDEAVKERKIEIRFDPLTGKTSRILDKPLDQNDEGDMSDVEKDGFCPFCPENLEKVGARDTKILLGEMLKQGEARLLANVTPYSEYSTVVRLTEEHHLSLNEFEERHFVDGLKLVIEYLKKMEDIEEKKFPAVIMNYLKPAGSSIVHPHMQLLFSESMMDYQRRLVSNAEEYFEEEEKSYWENLVKEERGGKRAIGKTGGNEWISAFAPRGFDHVKGINPTNLLDFDDDELSSFSEGITNVLQAYGEMGRNSFNFSIFIPTFRESRKFSTVIDMITRTNLDKFYRADDFAMPKLLDESYSNMKPEELAKKVRDYF
ncbi:MAG: hypothetical protein V5A76_05385 [Candidatus Thermoplasmatota archaeon]